MLTEAPPARRRISTHIRFDASHLWISAYTLQLEQGGWHLVGTKTTRILAPMVCVLTAWMSNAHAKPVPYALSKKGASADVSLLGQAYGDLHPGLYRYNSPRQIQTLLNRLQDALQNHPTQAEAYLAVSRFTAVVRCGHTYANFYNQTRAVQQSLFEGSNRVPFYFRWLGDKMVVTTDFTAHQVLPRGTQIVSINGIPTHTILAKLMGVARADGSNDNKRRSLMEVQGNDKYESFDIFFPLRFPKIGSKLAITAITPNAHSRKTIEVDAVTYAQRLAEMTRRPDDETHGWRLTYPKPNLAVLTMPDWALYDSHWDWKGFIHNTFASLIDKHVGNLVIDLRGNEGGSDIGDEILPHLVSRRVDIPAELRLVRYRRIPESLSPYLDTWDKSFRDWGKFAIRYDARFYRLDRWQSDATMVSIQPAALHYPGHLFVLVDATNSSATFQFAQQVQQNHFGTLIGTPTGGNLRGINGGAFFFLRLPNSGIEVDLPLIATFPKGDLPDRGLQPDMQAETTVSDIANNVDPDMALVNKLTD